MLQSATEHDILIAVLTPENVNKENETPDAEDKPADAVMLIVPVNADEIVPPVVLMLPDVPIRIDCTFIDAVSNVIERPYKNTSSVGPGNVLAVAHVVGDVAALLDNQLVVAFHVKPVLDGTKNDIHYSDL